MKTIIFIVVFAIPASFLPAQNIKDTTNLRPSKILSLSILGDASLISFNFEKLYFINPNYFISGKLGLGYNEEFQICLFGPCQPPEKFVTIPHHITWNFGKKKHFFELGLGGTFIIGNTSQPYLFYPIVGYRIHPLKFNKVNFRLFVYYPFTGEDLDDILLIPVGINLGICF
jgi:hypothetical protein